MAELMLFEEMGLMELIVAHGGEEHGDGGGYGFHEAVGAAVGDE